MNEQELIARLQRRDEAAFEELIRLYEKKVYTLCARMCGNAEDAEEAAQDTFLALWRGIGSFRQESSLSTWIYRLASNACIDLLRRGKRNVSGPSLDDEESFLDAADPAPTPHEEAERRELQRQLREGYRDGLPLPGHAGRVLHRHRHARGPEGATPQPQVVPPCGRTRRHHGPAGHQRKNNRLHAASLPNPTAPRQREHPRGRGPPGTSAPTMPHHRTPW